jgi:hypothetical protein
MSENNPAPARQEPTRPSANPVDVEADVADLEADDAVDVDAYGSEAQYNAFYPFAAELFANGDDDMERLP